MSTKHMVQYRVGQQILLRVVSLPIAGAPSINRKILSEKYLSHMRLENTKDEQARNLSEIFESKKLYVERTKANYYWWLPVPDQE